MTYETILGGWRLSQKGGFLGQRVKLFFAMKLLKLFLCVFTLSVSCLAQLQPTAQNQRDNKSYRLDETKPSVYVSFEKYGKAKPLFTGESGERIWLRFNNNCKWKIYVRTFGKKSEYGDFGLLHTVEIIPRWKEKIKESEIPAGYKISASVLTLESGKSISFSIPRENLSEGLYVSIGFSYEWEWSANGGGGTLDIVHRTTFFSTSLPPETY